MFLNCIVLIFSLNSSKIDSFITNITYIIKIFKRHKNILSYDLLI